MSGGEDRLAVALEKALKPPWAMYRNVAWLEKRPDDEPADGEADLVVAHPDLGVMVIEVKGGRVGRIGGLWESVDRNGHASCRARRRTGCPSPAPTWVPPGRDRTWWSCARRD